MFTIHWLRSWWYAHLRQADVHILWPICKEHAGSLDLAKAAFAVHVYHDRAWRILGQEEINRCIDELT